MRCGARRMHANVRALSVSRHSARSGDADRPGLRAGRERLRMQAEIRDGTVAGTEHNTVKKKLKHNIFRKLEEM